MKTCERCNGKLSTADKASLSSVCTTCAVEAGELTPVMLLPIMPLRPRGRFDAWGRFTPYPHVTVR